MWIEGKRLREWAFDKNGKRYKKTIATFDTKKPTFHIPFIYRGSADDLTKNIKNKTINLILTDPTLSLSLFY